MAPSPEFLISPARNENKEENDGASSSPFAASSCLLSSNFAKPCGRSGFLLFGLESTFHLFLLIQARDMGLAPGEPFLSVRKLLLSLSIHQYVSLISDFHRC
jgi:hypothetical protein